MMGLVTVALYTVEELAARLHKSPRWLQDFLRGRPIGRMAGRTRLFTDADLMVLRRAMQAVALDRFGANAKAKQDAGHIYFIEGGDFIKIGYTRSLKARLVKMLTDSPHALRPLHVEPGTFKQEKVIHRQFDKLRARGEWFRKTPELLEFIEQRKRIRAGEA